LSRSINSGEFSGDGVDNATGNIRGLANVVGFELGWREVVVFRRHPDPGGLPPRRRDLPR
jgi:hypothetical protein